MPDSLNPLAEVDYYLGEYAQLVEKALAELHADRAVERIWSRDGALWATDPRVAAEVEERLGWLDLPDLIDVERPRVVELAVQVREAGYRQAALLGMGGSSLGPEVLRQVLGPRPGYLDLAIVDTTDPGEIRHLTVGLDLAHTLFLVASKSGTTAETRAQYLYFRSLLRDLVGDGWSQQFVAITDRGTPLADLALEERFRALFYGRPDVGGRFSVLSAFGLVPAALLGVDLDRLAASARAMAHSAQPGQSGVDNTALYLGAILGALARDARPRRDKLTLLTSPRLASFGAWAEQLIAESTGKDGRGIVPVDGERVIPAIRYGPDRLFVYLRLDGDDNADSDAFVGTLQQNGQPFVRLHLRDPYTLGAEFFRWEFATAVAGQLLNINPFDQPNVEAAKQQARQALSRYEQTRQLDEPTPVFEDDCFAIDGPPARAREGMGAYLRRVLSEATQPGGYVAIMAYLERGGAAATPLAALRVAIARQTGLATTLGYGPRFLHSTGQLHKGGPEGGVFVQITAADDADVSIPGEAYSFGILKRAQALGDLAALRSAGRRAIHVHLKHGGVGGLERLSTLLDADQEKEQP